MKERRQKAAGEGEMPGLSFPFPPPPLPSLPGKRPQDVQMLRKTTAREHLWVGHGLWDAHGCSGRPEALEESTVSHNPKGQKDMCVSNSPLQIGDPNMQC